MNILISDESLKTRVDILKLMVYGLGLFKVFEFFFSLRLIFVVGIMQNVHWGNDIILGSAPIDRN